MKMQLILVAMGVLVVLAGAFMIMSAGSGNGDISGNTALHMEGHNHAMITSEVLFIDEMIPHHQEAVDTSRIMLDSENAQVVTLAERIVSAQEMEIEEMNNWREEWFSDKEVISLYTKMMPDLTKLSGVERDRAFLNGMIMHHQMAIMMAHQLLALSPREELREMGEAIISAQTAEIVEMKGILDSL